VVVALAVAEEVVPLPVAGEAVATEEWEILPTVVEEAAVVVATLVGEAATLAQGVATAVVDRMSRAVAVKLATVAEGLATAAEEVTLPPAAEEAATVVEEAISPRVGEEVTTRLRKSSISTASSGALMRTSEDHVRGICGCCGG